VRKVLLALLPPSAATFALLCGAFLTSAQAQEAAYLADHCAGETEYTLPDDTRVDCLTDEYAIEYEMGPRWAEAIGQSLHYAMWTQRQPGIVLIYKNPDHIERLVHVIAHYDLGIRVWLIYDDKE